MTERTSQSTDRSLKVFLCHASDDKPVVRELYEQLCNIGLEVWFDEVNLLPGQNWQHEIRKALRASDVVLVCLSNKAVTKAGFIQKEMRVALDIAEEQPAGTIFIIPVKVEECPLPEGLLQWQSVDYYKSGGLSRLVRGLQFRARELGIAMPLPENTTETTAKRPRTKIFQLIESMERKQEDERQNLHARLKALREDLTVFHRELSACIRFINTDSQIASLHINDLVEQLEDFRQRFPVLDAEYDKLRDSHVRMPNEVILQIVNGKTRIEELTHMIDTMKLLSNL